MIVFRVNLWASLNLWEISDTQSDTVFDKKAIIRLFYQ